MRLFWRLRREHGGFVDLDAEARCRFPSAFFASEPLLGTNEATQLLLWEEGFVVAQKRSAFIEEHMAELARTGTCYRAFGKAVHFCDNATKTPPRR